MTYCQAYYFFLYVRQFLHAVVSHVSHCSEVAEELTHSGPLHTHTHTHTHTQ